MTQTDQRWPYGGDEMAGHIRAFDWATTSLGPIAAWSERLQLMVEQVLASPLVSSLVCGTERLLIYNNAAAKFYGARHPAALGHSLPETFPEGWTTVAPFYERAFAGNTAQVAGQPLDTRGEGEAMDVFDALLTPVRETDGHVAYVHMIGFEIGARVRGEAALRTSEARQAFLLKLSDALRAEPNPDAVANRALQMLFDHLRLDRCYIAHYRPADDAADFPYQLGNDTVPPLPAQVRLSDFPDAYEQVLDRTFVIEDDFERRGLSQAERASSKALGMRAMVASTIRRGERTPLCSMVAVSSRPRRWSPADIALVEETAERTWAAVEHAWAEMRVRGSEERLRQFGEASSDVLWIRDAETLQWTYLTLAFETIYGLDRESALRGDNMAGWLDMIVPDDQPHAIAAIDRVRAGERVSFEYRIQQPEGGAVRWLRNTDFPIRDAVGKLRWLGGVGRDITEEKAAIQRQEVLVNELQHRSRNLLGVVTAVAGKTLRQGGSVDAFEERMQALSRAQALLSQAGSDMVEVGALVQAELAAHILGGSERVSASGPKVQLTARQVQNFALALHELTTNAVKYGALRDGTGWLAVTWEIIHDKLGRRRLALSWIESGVVIDPAKATRRGYGTELIQEALSYALGADVDYKLSADGVRCRIEMPIT